MKPPIVLGSASPRRARILAAMGVQFDVRVVDAAEIHGPDPVACVVENARRKFTALRPDHAHACLISADTLVFFQGHAIGKPKDLDHAAAMLRAFSGRTQLVFTAVALALPGQPPQVRVAASSVRFKPLSPGLIDDYLRTVQPLDRAGAYDIDAGGERLIAACQGSWTNVMGLPAEAVADWLNAQGISARLPDALFANRLSPERLCGNQPLTADATRLYNA